MTTNGSDLRAITDFLGSTQVFSATFNDLMTEHLREVTGNRLTLAQLKVLKLVSDSGRLGTSDVANLLGISSPAASKAVDRLVQSDLLHRTQAKKDRRGIRITPTEEGLELLARYEEATEKALDSLFDGISIMHLSELAEWLDRLSIRIIRRREGEEVTCFRCGVYFRDKCLLRDHHEHACYLHLREQEAAQDFEPAQV
jgi:DNA-binding MarR family transcriptional regulator